MYCKRHIVCTKYNSGNACVLNVVCSDCHIVSVPVTEFNNKTLK